jgi:hypothetical protein
MGETMIIKIKNKPSKVELPFVKKALHWYSRQLLSSKMNTSVQLKVIFTQDLFKKSKCLAFCTWTESNHRPRDFEIEIDSSLCKKSLLRALAHEMVHVKQYATGQLKDYVNNNDTLWEGKTYKGDRDGDEYWTSPWEIEAYGREVGLYVLFKRHLIREKSALKR